MVTKATIGNAEPCYLLGLAIRGLLAIGNKVTSFFYLLEKGEKREGGICVYVGGSKRVAGYLGAKSLKATPAVGYSGNLLKLPGVTGRVPCVRQTTRPHQVPASSASRQVRFGLERLPAGMSEETMNIRVINYATGLRPEPGEVEIYVGRSRWVGISPLGNPFSRAKYGRDECIGMFRDWLAGRLSDPASDQAIELESIRQISKDHPIALRCHCAPLPCHADVIKELLEVGP